MIQINKILKKKKHRRKIGDRGCIYKYINMYNFVRQKQ